MKITRKQLSKIIRESRFAAGRKLALDIIEELRDAEDGVPVNALYNVIFRAVDPKVLTDEIDHLVDIGYAEWQGDVLYLGHIPPNSQYAQKPFVENAMKITRRQLRRIIREVALNQQVDEQAQEAFYALVYVNGYMTGLSDKLWSTAQRVENFDEHRYAINTLDDKLGGVWALMSAGMNDALRANPRLKIPERDSIRQEGQSQAEADFMEDVYRCIEKVDTLVNAGTPIGMSAAEALGFFGGSGGGAAYRDTVESDVRSVLALMNNDTILSFLDYLESEKNNLPARRIR